MKPEIIFIRSYGRDDGFRSIPWGIVNIASYLKKYGYRAIIMDRKDRPYSLRRLIKEIPDTNISYVGISAMTSQAEDAEFLCKYFRKIKMKTILGGLHYSIYPEEGLKIGDYVFKGESERSLLNFLENGPRNRIYEPDPLLDLDEIPLPTKDLLDSLYIRKDQFTIITSWGCSYNCTFCVDEKYRFHKIRYHSTGYVCDLIEMLMKDFKVRSFWIGDDIFTLNKKRVFQICQEIKKKSLKTKLGGFTHSGIDDLELYKEMKDAGFESISLGVESGSDVVLKAMNKQQTVEQTRKTIGIIKKSGLKVTVTFMVGNVLETEESLKASLALAEELGLAGWVSYAQPLPGTKFYAECLQYGRLVNSNPKTYWNDRLVFVPRGLSRLKLTYYRNKIALVLKAPVSLRAKLINKFYLGEN